MSNSTRSEVETDRPAPVADVPGARETKSHIPPSIDLYLVRTRRGRFVLFVTRRALAAFASSEKDRFLRFIRRMMRSRNRVVRWVGRVTRTGHRYYPRLEDRIDPQERMVKALNYPGKLVLWHAPGVRAGEELGDIVRGHVIKHTTWVVLDGLATSVAIVLAPILVPIPGPNVFFFYPFLRLLSHVQALRGARRALAGSDIRFRQLADLDLDRPARDDGADPVEGLGEFLARAR
jgi:hypothetical protein